MSDIIAYKVGDEILDTQSYQGGGEPIYFDNSDDALNVIRHSTAHLLAAAVKSLYKDAKFFVGPA
nr:threonine--tRNA ligase [Campylobacter sp.]